MKQWQGTRRELGKAVLAGTVTLAAGSNVSRNHEKVEIADLKTNELAEEFLIRSEELTLRYHQRPGHLELSFDKFKGEPEAWRKACRAKFRELIGYSPPSVGKAKMLRTVEHEGVTIEAWVMTVGDNVSIPAYVLAPSSGPKPGRAVIAIHGHGSAESCIGVANDYHHKFALRTAQKGYLVFCPELRGFGALRDMAASDEDHRLDYWIEELGRSFSLVSDAFLHGETLIGQTVADMVRWEDFFARRWSRESFDVVGVSYGGDLAFMYPVFSNRVRSIYASGSMGSFSAIFARCYNAPAHCIPGVLRWMDRSDIAGLNAPRPIRLHYGEEDIPGSNANGAAEGDRNYGAAYNETVVPAYEQLQAIYHASGAKDQVSIRVTPESEHGIDVEDLLAFLSRQ